MDEEHGAEVADENAGRGEGAEDAVGDAVTAADGAVGENGEVVVAGGDGHSMDHSTVVTVYVPVQQAQTVPTCGLFHHNGAQTAGEGHGDAEADVISDGGEEEDHSHLVASPSPASRACLLALLPRPVKNAYAANSFTVVKIETVVAKTRRETVDFTSR